MSAFSGIPEKRATQPLMVGMAGTCSTSSIAIAFLNASMRLLIHCLPLPCPASCLSLPHFLAHVTLKKAAHDLAHNTPTLSAGTDDTPLTLSYCQRLAV